MRPIRVVREGSNHSGEPLLGINKVVPRKEVTTGSDNSIFEMSMAPKIKIIGPENSHQERNAEETWNFDQSARTIKKGKRFLS